MQTIGIIGGTGFVGGHLKKLLLARGHNVIIFTRDVANYIPEPNLRYAHWNLHKGVCDLKALREADAIVNLAGAGIADKRWTELRKEEIKNSRTQTTAYLVNQILQYAPNCKAFIAASAIGFYGEDNGGGPFNEDAPPATDFLGETCRLWEAESLRAAENIRTAVLRFGIVLGKENGALPQLAMPLNFRLKPILGTGRQMVSWIAVSDLAEMLAFAISNNISGIYNAVAPQPVSHFQLMNSIAKVKGGPFIPVHTPAVLLKMMLGEMSVEVLKSCTVSSTKIQEKGFTFNHPNILNALHSIYKSNA